MHTETDAIILNSMQQQRNHHQELTPQQQHYMTLLSQDQIMPEQHQQQVFAHLPSTTTETTIALSEGFYAPTPQQHLTSECLSQYYSGTSRLGYPTTSSSSSSSSNSSSDESIYSCSRSLTNQNCKNNTNKHTASIGVNLRVTGQCSQGGRKYMEDYFSVAYQQSENAKDLEYAFIGIYDGHGGAEAAKFAKEHLMMEIINQRLFWSDNDHDVLRAIREGYIATHYAMWREQDKWPKTANGLPSTAGTTATVAFIRREKIYIGHVGDSGIVLGYQNENENFWRAKQLTVDHKPESVEERTRIMNSGGKVVVKSGVPRVVWNRPRNASHRGPIRKKTVIDEIPFLAVARSLGDLWSYNSQRNEFVVSPDPDVKVIPIDSNTFRCLIFGTDGLWNVVSAQAAVNTVRDKEMLNERLLVKRDDRPYEGNQLTNPSKSLVDQALHTWSNKKMRADNTSVVTVILYPPGQVDHSSNTGCKEMHEAANNPPAFLQPVSYGLEYTQVQAEVPVYDNATTYKEMALKYLAPEAYRNFNYYAEESDTEGNDNEESEGEEHVMLMAKPPPGDLQQNTNYQQQFSTSNNWKWEENNTNNYPIGKDRQGEEEEDEEDGQDDGEEDEENIKDEAAKEKHINNNQRQVCIINYQNYMHNEAEETNNATDSYINTFVESYNSLLTVSQDKCVTAETTSSSPSLICNNSNSNSNSNCQSVTPPNMHAILQEQQLYQQQCMSEEEGYSLTKLETRREQQRTYVSDNRSSTQVLNDPTAAVQTFKIFHESQGQLLPQNPQQIELYHDNTERFYHHQQQQFIPKPLELHSLLQQEREEEQQVAYERLQMANKLQQQHQNISAYACLQKSNSITTPLEEYLEEEDSVAAVELIATETNNSCLQQDESVQINEISSSSCVDESRMETSCSEFGLGHNEIIERNEILPDAILERNTEEYSVEIKSDIFKSSKYSPICKNSTCLPSPPKIIPAPSALALTSSFNPALNRSKRAKSSYLYNNVPNENRQRISNSKYNLSMYFESETSGTRKRSMCMTPSASNKTSSVSLTPPAATSTPIIQRQLRSTTTPPNTPNATPMMDYGKRTLRTRNSLSKDMKAKSALVQSTLKYPPNTVTRNFLRTTATNLIVGKPLHLNDINVTPCKRRSLGTTNNVRTPNRSNIRTRREKTSVVFNGSLNQCKANIQNSSHPQLNLRSRHMTSTPSSAAASTPAIKRASLTERRILRSTPSKGSQTPANFSKSTRTQSTGSNLAAPPPSPKLINAVAAVAAATRARSLLNAKHVASANGTQSVVSAVFGKRTSLRSNGTTHPNVTPKPNISSSLSPPASAHQTLKGRIVKKLKR